MEAALRLERTTTKWPLKPHPELEGTRRSQVGLEHHQNALT